MTERDYLLVSALQRLRAARDLAADARPQAVLPCEAEWRKTVAAIDRMVERLEAEVERAMDDEPGAAGREG